MNASLIKNWNHWWREQRVLLKSTRKHCRSWSFITSKIGFWSPIWRNKNDKNKIYNIPKLSLNKKQKNSVYIWNIKHGVQRQLVPLSSFAWYVFPVFKATFLLCDTLDTVRFNIGAAKVSRLFPTLLYRFFRSR